MIRNLKALGLALVAMLAMGVMAASAAQAAEFTADEYPVNLNGTQVAGESHLFKTAGGREVTCETATFSGVLTEASTEASVEPTYENCHAIVLGSKLPATVTKSSPCVYDFKLTSGQHAHVQVTCNFTVDIYANHADHTAGKHLCTLHINSQGPLTTVTFANHEATGDITAKAEVNNIAVTRTGSLSCGASPTTAEYTGNTVIAGTNEEGAPVDGHVK